MPMVQPVLSWGNPHCQFHVMEPPGGGLEIMLGLHCVERVQGDANSVPYRMAMGRLVNAGWEVTALALWRGHDTRTLRQWGEALLCPDPAEMLRRLSGRGADSKVTDTMVEFVLDWWDELCGRVRNFRARILAKVAQVFKVQVSWEALRPALLARRRARAAVAAAGAVAPAAAGSDGSATGGASPESDEAEGAAETQAVAEPQPPTVSPTGLAEAVSAVTPGAGEPLATGCATSPTSREGKAGGESQPMADPGAVIPNGSAVPAAWPVLVHHAGQLLAAQWLDTAGLSPRTADGALLTWCAQVLQGGANIEQVRDLSSADLAWFTGVPVPRAPTQRGRLGRLLIEDHALWLELLRGNARLLADGPGRGTVFYYDPHSKEYTGGLPFLKGWCGRRHSVAKVLHLDFFHTRSGHPCFVVPADNYEDMRERFFTELDGFDQLFPPAGRTGRLFIIDRGIYGIDTFARFTARGDWLLTWEKDYAGDGWVEGAPVVEFVVNRPRNRRGDLLQWTFRVQEQPWRRDPSWRRLVVRATNPQGRTIEAAGLCSERSMPADEAVALLFSRWLQENDFRILDRHFGIMQMTSRRWQAYAELAHTLPDRPVQSAEYRELHAAAAGLRRTLQKLLFDRERVIDTLARMARDSAAARRRLDRDLPRFQTRLQQCQAIPAGADRQLRDLAALGALAKELEQCRSRVRKATRGQPKLEERRQTLQVAIDTSKSQSEALEQRLQAADRQDSRLRLLAAEGCCRPDTAAKHLMDCVKIIARNVFYRLLGDFRRHYDNRRDDLPILRLVTRAAGTLHVHDGVLHVGLWLRASLEPATRTAIDGFLADLSAQINGHFAGRAIPVHVRLLPSAPQVG